MVRALNTIIDLQLGLRRANLLNVLQTGVLRPLVAALDEEFADPAARRALADYAQQLIDRYDELADWPDNK